MRAIIPEIAAAVAKIMSNKDLILAAAKIRNVARCRNTMGERGVLGIRAQPNHPADDVGGILLSAFEGLLYGCGDAVIGVNPASDSVDAVLAILNGLARLVDAYKVPTQTCCPGARHYTTCRDGARGAGGFAVSVDWRHGGDESKLRNYASDVARGA